MSTLAVTLIAIGTFLAGYLLRGWLAVLWERKRRRTDILRRYAPPAPMVTTQLGRPYDPAGGNGFGTPVSPHPMTRKRSRRS